MLQSYPFIANYPRRSVLLTFMHLLTPTALLIYNTLEIIDGQGYVKYEEIFPDPIVRDGKKLSRAQALLVLSLSLPRLLPCDEGHYL
jgi:hypothetical protein